MALHSIFTFASVDLSIIILNKTSQICTEIRGVCRNMPKVCRSWIRGKKGKSISYKMNGISSISGQDEKVWKVMHI